MSNLYNGYAEPQSQTDARAFKIAMASKGYGKTHNTEAEIDRVRDLIDCAEMNDTSYSVRLEAATSKLKSLMSKEEYADWNNQRSSEIEKHLIHGTPYTSSLDAALALISDYEHPVDEPIDATLHAEDYDSTPTPSDMPVINFDDVQEVEY